MSKRLEQALYRISKLPISILKEAQKPLITGKWKLDYTVSLALKFLISESISSLKVTQYSKEFCLCSHIY